MLEFLESFGVGFFHFGRQPEPFNEIERGARARRAPLLRAAMERSSVTGEGYDGLWIDVGTPQRLAALNRLLAARRSC